MKLPTVTCMIVDCIDPVRAGRVLDRCQDKCEFGAVKLLTSEDTSDPRAVKIIPLNSLVAYSIFVLTRLHEFFDTSHVLIVQRDGWILNPQSWDPKWLELDYIGPIFMQYDKVGSGGFSLRSKRLMKETAKKFNWDGTETQANEIQKQVRYYEDGFICFMLASRFKIATLEQAANFAQGGNRNPEYFREFPFGFHRSWQPIDFTTGRVDSSDPTREIQSSYDPIIDAL